MPCVRVIRPHLVEGKGLSVEAALIDTNVLVYALFAGRPEHAASLATTAIRLGTPWELFTTVDRELDGGGWLRTRGNETPVVQLSRVARSRGSPVVRSRAGSPFILA